jgi:hypothetical protein
MPNESIINSMSMEEILWLIKLDSEDVINIFLWGYYYLWTDTLYWDTEIDLLLIGAIRLALMA